MTRQERLKFCKACRYQKSDEYHGVICSVTNAPASFEVACTIYNEDPELKQQMVVELAQGDLSQESATMLMRFVNRFIDVFCIVFLLDGVRSLLSMEAPENIFQVSPGVQLQEILISLLATLIFYIIFESLTGRSPGKFLTNTKVVDVNGNKPDFTTVLRRSLCRVVPFEEFSFFGGIDKGWHDKWSKTKVVKA
ncbi:MAG: RDD family protein [Marinilabiliaceae bacterium]|nr:RDD family protein [Marinilabiliaceae bacterium]